MGDRAAIYQKGEVQMFGVVKAAGRKDDRKKCAFITVGDVDYFTLPSLCENNKLPK